MCSAQLLAWLRNLWAFRPSQDWVYCVFKNTSNGNSWLSPTSIWIICPLGDKDLHGKRNNTEMGEKISAFGGMEHPQFKELFSFYNALIHSSI